jgi:hypothetical protein
MADSRPGTRQRAWLRHIHRTSWCPDPTDFHDADPMQSRPRGTLSSQQTLSEYRGRPRWRSVKLGEPGARGPPWADGRTMPGIGLFPRDSHAAVQWHSAAEIRPPNILFLRIFQPALVLHLFNSHKAVRWTAHAKVVPCLRRLFAFFNSRPGAVVLSQASIRACRTDRCRTGKVPPTERTQAGESGRDRPQPTVTRAGPATTARDEVGHLRTEIKGPVVRVVGLEPTLLAERVFETLASTIPPHPQRRAPMVRVPS